jgi:hypothetical protein
MFFKYCAYIRQFIQIRSNFTYTQLNPHHTLVNGLILKEKKLKDCS